MKFNKEKGINNIYLIDNEEVSEEAFYSLLEEAISDEYDNAAFDTYLRDNYNDIDIEGYYYEPNEVLEAMQDYDKAYSEWLDDKKQSILYDFSVGFTSCMCIYGSYFEIREANETLINIQLKMEEVKRLYFTLNINNMIANNLLAKIFIDTLEQLIEEELQESEDEEQC